MAVVAPILPIVVAAVRVQPTTMGASLSGHTKGQCKQQPDLGEGELYPFGALVVSRILRSHAQETSK